MIQKNEKYVFRFFLRLNAFLHKKNAFFYENKKFFDRVFLALLTQKKNS